MVIVQIEPRFIGILAYPRVVLALQRTVLPDLVADEPAFVIILVAPFLLMLARAYRLSPFHQQAFPVGLGAAPYADCAPRIPLISFNKLWVPL